MLNPSQWNECLTLINQNQPILLNSANIPTAKPHIPIGNFQETFFMYLQFHKTVFFPMTRWLADCLDPHKKLTYQHMFCKPSFITSKGACYPESKTLLSQKRVSSITTAKWLDFTVMWKMSDDSLVWIARPWIVRGRSRFRNTNWVKALNKVTITKNFQHVASHTGHDTHTNNNIRGISNLNTNLRDRWPNRTHTETQHIHGAAWKTEPHLQSDKLKNVKLWSGCG